MRRRALLLAFLAGALAVAGGATLGADATPRNGMPLPTTALARAELADVPTPTALSRSRDDLGREQDTRRDVAVALALGLALILAAGWWLARERAARSHRPLPLAARRTRAPPRSPSIVHC
jgi:hypothetical protein